MTRGRRGQGPGRGRRGPRPSVQAHPRIASRGARGRRLRPVHGAAGRLLLSPPIRQGPRRGALRMGEDPGASAPVRGLGLLSMAGSPGPRGPRSAGGVRGSEAQGRPWILVSPVGRGLRGRRGVPWVLGLWPRSPPSKRSDRIPQPGPQRDLAGHPRPGIGAQGAYLRPEGRMIGGGWAVLRWRRLPGLLSVRASGRGLSRSRGVLPVGPWLGDWSPDSSVVDPSVAHPGVGVSSVRSRIPL